MSWSKIIGILCASAIGLGVLFYAGENLRGKAAWEKFKKEWEAKGEVFDYRRIIPQPVPSQDNFAHTPLLKPLLAHQWNAANTEVLKEPDPAKIQRANDLMKFTGETPGLVQWRLGRSVDLAAWQTYFRDHTERPNPKAAGQPAADILFALKKYDAEFQELTAAAKTRPRARFDINYEATFAALLPHLTVLRKASKGFALRAVAHLSHDDSNAALADAQMGLFLTETIQDEPLLISQLVRIAMLEIALQPIWEGLKNNQWNAAQLELLENQLGRIDMLQGYAIAIRGERDLANLMIERMREMPKKQLGQLMGNEGVPMHLIPTGWIYQNQKNINHLHISFTLPVVDPKTRRIHPEFADQMDQHFSKPRRGPYNILANLLMPAVSRVGLRVGSAQTAVDHAQIACRLARNKLNGTPIPPDLAGLNPALPQDPFTGKPYHYRRMGEHHYRLYSVGWNLKNEGGQPAFQNGSDQLNFNQGDWVWQYTPVPLPSENQPKKNPAEPAGPNTPKE